MKILLVEFSPSGGLFQFGFQLGHGLAELGHDVELLTGPDPELSSEHPRFRVVPVLPTWHPAPPSVEHAVLRKARRILRALQYVHAWRRLVREIATRSPDVVQWGSWRFTVDGLFVRFVARRRRRPVLVDLCHEPRRSSWPTVGVPRQNPVYRWSLGGAFRAMDAVLVLGDRVREDFREVWPGARRVEVIPHGDESVFLTTGVAPVEHTGMQVLFFGTLAGYKGIDVLLDAWSQVRSRLPAAELVLAGAPGDVDLRELQRRADALGGVTLRIGYVPMADVPALFRAARVVVVPYVSASQSGVVHLAQTFARPVVATEVGDIPDVVTDGETGVLVPPRDPEALARGLEALLVDIAEAARRGEAGRARLAHAASWTSVARRVQEIFEELLADRGRASAGERPARNAS